MQEQHSLPFEGIVSAAAEFVVALLEAETVSVVAIVAVAIQKHLR